MPRMLCALLLAIAALALPLTVDAAIPLEEREALVALYTSTGGDDWNDRSNWLAAVGTECTWFGVTCDATQSTVTMLELQSNNLQGPIPSEVGKLENLQRLHLFSNQLTGAVPPQIGSLTSLVNLNLSGNQLTGVIPPELGQLINLDVMAIARNDLSGEIPVEFQSLQALRYLGLSSNDLTGPIPPELGNLRNLRWLFMGDNELDGPIPAELGNLSNLESLDLSNNRLTGGLPPELRGRSSMISMLLYSNALSGDISLGSLSGVLTVLDLDDNALYATDPVVHDFILLRNRNFDLTQTLAPTEVSASVVGATSAAFTWVPMLFADNTGPGRYEVWADAGKGSSAIATTADKHAAGLTVTGLEPGMTYTFKVRTISDPNPNNPKNTVRSDFSNTVTLVIPPPSLSISDASVPEGDAETRRATLSVSLSDVSPMTVTVDYATADGTASADDYVEAQGTLTFQPGELTKEIDVQVLGDTDEEPDETVFVNLSRASNATIGDGVGWLTIINDDISLPPPPDPTIVTTGCVYVGDPCNMRVTSTSGADIAGWAIQWFIDGARYARGPICEPSLTVAGSYAVKVETSNLSGFQVATTTITLDQRDPCPNDALCAAAGRTMITLDAVDPRTGNHGEGLPLQQNDLFGYFSIPSLTFNPENPEVFVKVLDGRNVNGSYWVFYGGLTDLAYTLTVTDTETQTSTTYEKPGGSSAGGFDVGGGVAPEECPNEVDGVEVGTVAPSSCETDEAVLCFSGRFRVELDARDHRTGRTGSGLAIPQSDLFGYFAIPGLTFNPDNPEVFVKLLDGRAVNGYWWLFYSGLTDLEYTLRVTDTTTGDVKVYFKAAGSACGAFDVDAFD